MTAWEGWKYIAWMRTPDGDVEAKMIAAYAADRDAARMTMRIVGCLATGNREPGDVTIVDGDDD